MKDPLLGGVIASAAWIVRWHGEDSMAVEMLIKRAEKLQLELGG